MSDASYDDTQDPAHDDLRARLHALDPAASLPPADPARVARLLEDTVSHDPQSDTSAIGATGAAGLEGHETRETGTRGRSRLTWLVAAAAAVLIGGVGVVGLLVDDRDTSEVPSAGPSTPEPGVPTTTVLAAAPAAAVQARCALPSAELLSRAQVAFAGTVTQVDDEVVTLAADRFYAGEATDTVEVRSPAALVRALVGVVDFQVGERYLVAATDGQVMVCGFSGAATADLEALYVSAFPG